jgi:hypothetical protein
MYQLLLNYIVMTPQIENVSEYRTSTWHWYLWLNTTTFSNYYWFPCPGVHVIFGVCVSASWLLSPEIKVCSSLLSICIIVIKGLFYFIYLFYLCYIHVEDHVMNTCINCENPMLIYILLRKPWNIELSKDHYSIICE